MWTINTEKKWRIILWSLIIIFSLALSILGIARYYGFYTLEDTGEFSQMLWATLQGRLFYTNLAGIGPLAWVPHNYLGEHFSPILFLLIPLYALYQEPETLLIIQSIVLGLAALPLYMIVQERFKNHFLSISFSTVWLISPYIWQSNISGFHLDTFEPLFIFSAFYFLFKKRIFPYFIFVFLLLSCKEDTFFYVVGIGIYTIISMKEIKTGLYAIAIGLLWGVLTFNVFMPYFKEGIEGGYSYLIHYSQFGNSFSEIFKTFLLKPQEVVLHLIQRPILETIFYLFLTVLFLPLFSIGGLILLSPSALQKLLANSPHINTLSWYYSASVLPFFFIAAITGMSNISKLVRRGNLRIVFLGVIGVLVIITCIIMSIRLGLGLYGGLMVRMPVPAISRDGFIWFNKRDLELSRFLKSIPVNSSISTNSYIVAHVSKNFDISVYPYRPLNKDIILLDIYGEKRPYDLNRYKQAIWEILSKKDYGVVEHLDGFIYLKKGYDTSRNEAVAKEIFGLFEADEVYMRSIRKVFDFNAGNKIALFFDNKRTGKDATIYGPYISLPSGKYEVSFRLKIKRKVHEDIARIDVSVNEGRKILVESNVRGSDFLEEGRYEEFRLKFHTDERIEKVEFRVHLYGEGGIWVDRINLYPEDVDLKALMDVL